MVTFAQLVCALLLPLGLGVLLSATARGLLTSSARQAEQDEGQRGLGGFLVVFIVIIAQAACAAAIDAPLVPPRAGWFWLPWALLIGVLPAVTLTFPSGWWRWSLHGVLAGAGGSLVLFPVSHSAHDVLISGLWIAAAVACVGLSAWATRTRSTTAWDEPQPLTEQAAAAIVGGLVAAGALLSGSKDFALLAMIVPMGILGLAVSSRLLVDRPDRPAMWAGGNLATAHVVALTLLINGHYSEMPWYGALALAAALPLGGFAAQLGQTDSSKRSWRLGVTIAIGLVGVVLILLLGQPPAAASDGPDYHY